MSRRSLATVVRAGLSAGVFASLAALPAAAAPVVVPIDQSASFLEVTVNLSGFTDSDSSPVSGSVTVDPADPNAPGNLVFSAYSIALTENLNLVLGGGFIGSFTININGLTVTDAFNGQTFAAPIVNNAFTLDPAPSVLGGTVNYTATGLFCALLGGAGLPCVDATDLADLGEVSLILSGTVEVANNTISLAATVNATAPLDPANPSLGTISFNGELVGSAELPPPPACVGDLNNSGAIDSDDLGVLLGDFGCAAGCLADLTGDGAVDSDDLGVLLGVFGTACD